MRSGPVRPYRDVVMKPLSALVELPRPRVLTQAEHALVTRLAAFANIAYLTEQVATVRVVSTCDCGCGSVGLRSERPPVPAAVVARLSGSGRDDYFAVSASSGADISVVLHVVGGMVGELEIFAGEDVKVTAPDVGSLTNLWIG